ncbi:MAG: hypothetical protein ABEH66_02220 [Halobacteriales archaeon]
MVTLSESLLGRYAAVSLYNSPYRAHDEGRGVDLYPGDGSAPSPVSGEVIATETVRAPFRPGVADQDHLVVIDTGERLARILHVDPAVEAGDRLAVGDDLGETVRTGYFDPWVDDHLHLGFRPPGADPVRASGSLPVDLDAPIEPVAWDGTGEVHGREETYAVLDAPTHPAPGEAFAGVAAGGGALDGGLPHYERGGVLGGDPESDAPVALAGTTVGTSDGRSVDWDAVEVSANGTPILGLSLALWRDRIAVTLVSRGDLPAPGESVTVGIEPRG